LEEPGRKSGKRVEKNEETIPHSREKVARRVVPSKYGNKGKRKGAATLKGALADSDVELLLEVG
jgi:hypothetical protein